MSVSVYEVFGTATGARLGADTYPTMTAATLYGLGLPESVGWDVRPVSMSENEQEVKA